MASHKVTPIDSEGKEFDPHTQEAVSQLPSADVAENVVMYQGRRGYVMGAKIMRRKLLFLQEAQLLNSWLVMAKRDLNEVLDVERGATQDEIKKHIAKSVKYHPDKTLAITRRKRNLRSVRKRTKF